MAIREIARQFGHSRKTVRHALKNAEPHPNLLTRDRLAPNTDPEKFLPDLSLTLSMRQDEAIRFLARRPHPCSSPITILWNNFTNSSTPFPRSEFGNVSRAPSSPNRSRPPRISPMPWDAHSKPSRTGSPKTIAGEFPPSTSDPGADVRHCSTPRTPTLRCRSSSKRLSSNRSTLSRDNTRVALPAIASLVQSSV